MHEQSAVRVFADKAVGLRNPGITIDGTDPDAIAAAFDWAVERARDGHGPALIELVAMRMCGHAHHDDMLYSARTRPPGNTRRWPSRGYANRERYEYWAARDPIPGLCREARSRRRDRARRSMMKREARGDRRVASSLVIEAPGRRRKRRASACSMANRRESASTCSNRSRAQRARHGDAGARNRPPFDRQGQTFLEARHARGW